MRKLELNIELLAIESFATDAEATGRGTVHGQIDGPNSGYNTCEGDTCGNFPRTCGYTCDDQFTCGGGRACR